MDQRARLVQLVNSLPDSKVEAAIRRLELLVNQEQREPPVDQAGSTLQVEFDDLEDDEVESEFHIRRLGTRLMTKNWGYGGIEEMESTIIEVVGNGRSLKLNVGQVRGGREAYGLNRTRFHVAWGTTVLVEFTGTDNFEDTGRVFSILKRGDGTYVKDGEVTPSSYRRPDFPLEPLADLVDDGKRYRSLAVVLDQGDLESMALYGFLRWIDREDSQ